MREHTPTAIQLMNDYTDIPWNLVNGEWPQCPVSVSVTTKKGEVFPKETMCFGHQLVNFKYRDRDIKSISLNPISKHKTPKYSLAKRVSQNRRYVYEKTELYLLLYMAQNLSEKQIGKYLGERLKESGYRDAFTSSKLYRISYSDILFDHVAEGLGFSFKRIMLDCGVEFESSSTAFKHCTRCKKLQHVKQQFKDEAERRCNACLDKINAIALLTRCVAGAGLTESDLPEEVIELKINQLNIKKSIRHAQAEAITRSGNQLSKSQQVFAGHD
jgi:hypothetical protein